MFTVEDYVRIEKMDKNTKVVLIFNKKSDEIVVSVENASAKAYSLNKVWCMGKQFNSVAKALEHYKKESIRTIIIDSKIEFDNLLKKKS